MRILDVLTAPWAIEPSKLQEIKALYQSHMKGPKVDWKGLQERLLAGQAEYEQKQADAPERGYDLVDGVAVINVSGVLTKATTPCSWLFGGTSMQDIGSQVVEAMADPSVMSVLFRIDSPGGTVDGTQELSELVYSFRGTKPMIAYTDGAMASGAYWIGSAADKLYISGDTVHVGSIGVVATHVDQSRADEMAGEKYTEITSGKFKRAASAHFPLSKDAREYLQEQVDYLFSAFVSDIARNKRISVEKALEMADGARIYIGKQAIEAGLVDGVSTYNSLINGLAAGDAAFYSQSEKEVETVNITEMKEKFPAVYQEIIDAGKAEGVQATAATVETAKAEALKAGAEAERARIMGLNAALIPGHEKLIEAAISDGISQPGDVALKIVAAEKATREMRLAALIEDGKEAGKVPGAAAPVNEKPSEKAGNPKEAGDKLDAIARKIKDEKKCSYIDAFAQAERENPKLATAYSMRKEG